MALWVARPLAASESAALGDGLPVVMLWTALAVVWLLGTLGRRSWTLRFGATDAAVWLLVGLYALSALWAVYHGSPRPAVNMLWEWVGFGLAFFMARQLMAGPQETRAVMAVMVALAVALSGYGLYQYRIEMPATRVEYRKDPDQALRAAGLWYPPGSRERWLFEQRLESPEPLATFPLTNSLAAFLAPWLIVTLGIAGLPGLGARDTPVGNALRGVPEANEIPGSRRQERHRGRSLQGALRWWKPLAALSLAVPIAACLVATKSRSSLIAAGVGLVLLYTARGRKWHKFVVPDSAGDLCQDRLKAGLRTAHLPTAHFRLAWKLLAAVGGAVLLAVVIATAGGGASRLLSLASKSLGYRLQYWQSSLAMIADHPWLGVGPGQFQNAYTAYMLPTASEEIADPHNFLIEVWATAGTPALLAMLAVLAAFGWTVLRSARQSSVGNALRGVPPPGEKGDPQFAESHAARSLQTEVVSQPASSGGIAASQDDHPGLVYLGAGCGFLLALPLGLMSGSGPSFVAVWLGLPMWVWLGLPLAAVTVALLHRWVVAGRLSPILPAIGVSVLLVNLLGAGGIASAGVVGTLWLLLAVGLNTAGSGERVASRPVGLILLAVAALLGVACFQTAYAPVLDCQAEIYKATKEGLTPEERQFHLWKAAKADGLSAQPWKDLAAITMLRWQEEPSDVAYALCETYRRAAGRLDPNSAAMWLRFGDDELAAYEKQPRQDRLEMAIRSYRRAVQHYPNSATCRAKLALACRTAGDQQAFRRQRDRAIELDRLTPHPDKKLPDELRRRLLRT